MVDLGLSGKATPANELKGEFSTTLSNSDDPERVTPVDEHSESVAIAAPGTNAAPVYFGGSDDLSISNGIPLPPGQSASLDLDVFYAPVFVAADTAGDGVRVVLIE